VVGSIVFPPNLDETHEISLAEDDGVFRGTKNVDLSKLVDGHPDDGTEGSPFLTTETSLLNVCFANELNANLFILGGVDSAEEDTLLVSVCSRIGERMDFSVNLLSTPIVEN